MDNFTYCIARLESKRERCWIQRVSTYTGPSSCLQPNRPREQWGRSDKTTYTHTSLSLSLSLTHTHTHTHTHVSLSLSLSLTHTHTHTHTRTHARFHTDMLTQTEGNVTLPTIVHWRYIIPDAGSHLKRVRQSVPCNESTALIKAFPRVCSIASCVSFTCHRRAIL